MNCVHQPVAGQRPTPCGAWLRPCHTVAHSAHAAMRIACSKSTSITWHQAKPWVPRLQHTSLGPAAHHHPHMMCRATAPSQQAGVDDEDEEELDELSQAQHVITVDDFAPDLCKQLRGVFDDRFGDPRRIHPERFMWDHWWCPDAEGTCQYHLVRTQAQVYFSPEQHEALVDALLAYGESQLGCRAITPIWMSYYTDGMVQELHCDNPHGPFAFVLSLTNWEGREFIGGETRIMTPQTLDYWNRPDPGTGLEHCNLMQLVPPLFGRLTVFDPRLPHGVRRVQGTQDPRKGRLVLHGWFTDPSPFFTGGLTAEEATPVLNEALGGAIEVLQEEAEPGEPPAPGAHPCTGVLTLKVHVDGTTGTVQDVTFLADTLVPVPSLGLDPAAVRAAVQHELNAWLLDATFPASKDGSDTFITLPVVFE